MVTFQIYFEDGRAELRLELEASGAETAIKIAKEHTEKNFPGFKFNGRVVRLYKSWL